MTSESEPNSVEEVPVLIVGGSLVGLTLSALLAHHGISGCLTVEKHSSTAVHPRATVMMPRTMQIFKELGLYEYMIEESRRYYDEEACIINVESLAGKLLKVWMKDVNEGIENISATRRVFLTQQALEPVLRAKCSDLGAEVRFATEMISFVQEQSCVTVRLRNNSSGLTYSVRARYMIGCDGFRSPTRASLDIPLHGPGLLSRASTIYFEVVDKEKLAILPNAKYSGVIYVSNPTLRAFFRFDKDKKESFLVINSAGEQGTEASRFPADTMTMEKAEMYLRAAIGVDDIRFKIHSLHNWEAVGHTPEQLRIGDVFLAGDAAHKMPPSGGFGGNTGIQDAHNLAWKLALVLRGQAGEGLLNTYQEERHQIAKVTVDNAVAHFVNRTEPTLKHLIEEFSIQEFPVEHLEMGYRYINSRALPETTDQESTEDPATAIAKPGSLAYHVLVSTIDGKLENVPISNFFGNEFILLTGPEGQVWIDALKVVLSLDSTLPPTKSIQLQYDNQSTFSQRYKVDTAGLVLIRPDGFVAEVIHSLPWGPFLQSILSAMLKRAVCLPASVYGSV